MEGKQARNSPFSNNVFDQFQLEEYKNISNSHFEAIKQVSTFFRYYLLLFSAPALIIALMGTTGNEISSFFEGDKHDVLYNFIFIYLTVIGITGFCILLYIINIRHDSILYARTVNKTRKYFYENSGYEIDELNRYKALPTIDSQPRYFDFQIFFPLVLAFSIINSSFLGGAFYLKRLGSEYIFRFSLIGDIKISDVLWIAPISFMCCHFIFWWYLSYKRENSYLKSYSFGVDIDGVINNQTDHFILWLEKLTGKKIQRENITGIPVHLNSNLGVSEYEERLVFNCKEYWQQLRFEKGALNRIAQIRKVFGYNIYFFSYRDWPQYGKDEKSIKKKIREKDLTPLSSNDMSTITKEWFRKEGLDVYYIDNYLKLIFKRFISKIHLAIEKGNPYVSDNRFYFLLRRQNFLLNRFQGAKQKRLRFFIEDSPENALKLSNLCEYVFLMDQPYNQREVNRNQFPNNVIRVNSWDEIYNWLKKMS